MLRQHKKNKFYRFHLFSNHNFFNTYKYNSVDSKYLGHCTTFKQCHFFLAYESSDFESRPQETNVVKTGRGYLSVKRSETCINVKSSWKRL